MTSSPPFALQPLLQGIGITGAAWLAGNIACYSMASVPALARSRREDGVPSSTVVRQWKHTYDAGKAQNPPIALATAGSLLYLAWSARSSGDGHSAILYTSSALLIVGIVPFTFTAMAATNNRLHHHDESPSHKKFDSPGAQAAFDKEVDQLTSTWVVLNGIRSLFPLAGCIVCLIAVLN